MQNDMYLRENEKVVLQAVMHKNKGARFRPLISIFIFLGFPIFCAVIVLTTGEAWYIILFLSPFFAVGIAFLIIFIKNIGIGKHISLILTDQRVFIYNKMYKGYINLEFKEINSWTHHNPSVKVFGVLQYNARFTFLTDKGTRVIAKGIENYYKMYNALYAVMPFKCSNPVIRSIVPKTRTIDW